MEKIVSKKPLVNESRTVEVPLAFAQLYAINPMNFPNWIVGMKGFRKKGKEIKVKDILDTRVNIALDDDGLYVDTIVGKDEHSILIKKPSAENGLDIILTENGKFKIEANMILKALDEHSCTAHVEVRLLEAEHKFHPITSMEIKHFFKKSLKNFIKESEKAYHTIHQKEKTIEAHVMSFYLNNVDSLKALIAPLKKDLGNENYEAIQKDLKQLAFDNSQKFHELMEVLGAALPAANLQEAGDKISKTVKDSIGIFQHISKKTHAVILADVNHAAKAQIETLKDIVPTIVSSLPTEKIVEIQKIITNLLESNVSTLQGILEEIKTKIPAKDFKSFENGLVKILKNDLAVTKTALDKLTAANPILSLEEAEMITNLKKVIEDYEGAVNSRNQKSYEQVFSVLQNALSKFNTGVATAASKITPETVERTKDLIGAATNDLFTSVDGILKEATPENLSENKAKFQDKINEILNRYAEAAKLIDPQLTEDQINSVKDQIRDILVKEYDSFTKENM